MNQRIGIVTNWFERGSAYVSRQYKLILEHKLQVYIYARDLLADRKNEAYAETNVHWGKKARLPVPAAVDLNDFRHWIEAKQLDVVFFNEQQWWEPVVMCAGLGIKTGAYVDYYTEETVQLFSCYDFVICNTKRHHSVFSWHPQAHYVPWGTDLETFKPMGGSMVRPGTVTFFHSCGYSPERKGTDILLEAFAGVEGPAHLRIHTQTDLRSRLKPLVPTIDKLEKQGRLEIVHGTVGAPGLYHTGDVYVYPSRLDGIGLTLIEALACGLPVITTDTPPMTEFIDPSCCLTVVPNRFWKRDDGFYWPMCEIDPPGLTAVMQSFVAKRSQLAAYKRCARKFAEKNLDWKQNARSLPDYFAHVVKLSDRDKTEAIRSARAYESRRSSLGVRIWRASPGLWRAVDFARNVLKWSQTLE